jgi:cytochrome c oxidase cbb3-type subunit IV
MTYQTVSAFAQTYGLAALIIMFAIAVTYALWPGNRKKFEQAARMPLEED